MDYTVIDFARNELDRYLALLEKRAENEDEVQPVLDTLYFDQITDWRITIDREAKFAGI